MATPHNAAQMGDFAKTVLMPGDPLRAKFIADTFLEDAKLVNNVRGIQGYTGTYKGTPVSVMASGMGMPSIGIYSHELFWDYRVERIVRAGTAGGLSPALSLRDVVLGVSCSTDSGFAAQFELPGAFAPCCSFSLASAADRIGREKGLSIRGGMLFSGAAFHYTDSYLRRWAEAGALAVEMETAALYMNAMTADREALAICTITDMVFTGERCSPQERQTSLDAMLSLALDTAVQ